MTEREPHAGASGAARARSLLKRLARIAGWAISLAAIAFFVRLLLSNGIAVPGRGGWAIAGISLAGALAYGLVVTMMAGLWALLVLPPGVGAGLARPIAAGYMKGMFAKYLPGNVFHYAARHALGRQLGIAHGRLAAAALVEIAMQIGAACFVVVLLGQAVLAAMLPALPRLPWPLAFAIPLAGVAIAVAPRPARLRWLPRYPALRILGAFAGYVLFYLAFGALFLGLLAWSNGVLFDPLRVIPTASLAWLVGFVVPGAPAGAGLREATLALASGESGDPSQATLAAIMLFRVATMGGDFLAFVGGWLLSRGPLPAAPAWQ
ncbi:MAG: hypothetical protein QM601_06950 [Pseudoxanthomonas sp.]